MIGVMRSGQVDPDDTSLTVTTAEGGTWAIVAVEGEIDVSTAHALDEALQAVMASSGRAIVDFSGVRFMDSTGLSVLMRAQHDQPAPGGKLRLAALPDRVMRLLSVTKLDSVFSVYPSVTAAEADPPASVGP
jgi:anti-sigma B factor antagonist